MKKWRGLEKELEDIESQLCDVGEILSRPIHNRIYELLKKLSKFRGTKLEYLMFGMGGWTLRGTILCFEEIEPDEGMKEFDVDLGDLICCAIWDFGRSNWAEGVERANPGITPVLKEIQELCSALVDTMYLQYCDLNEKEMQDLLDK